MSYTYYVYILTNERNTVLYTGMTHRFIEKSRGAQDQQRLKASLQGNRNSIMPNIFRKVRKKMGDRVDNEWKEYLFQFVLIFMAATLLKICALEWF